MIKGVLLDYDGVMTNVKNANMPPSERLAEVSGISPKEAARLFSEFWPRYLRGKLSDEELWTWIEEQTGKTVSVEERDIWAGWNQLRPLPEMVEFVAALRERGYPVGLLTNVTPTTEREVRTGGGYDGFDFTVKSCGAGYAKPEPKVYDIAMQHFAGLSPEEVVFVDDRAQYLEPARRLGMAAILSTSSSQVIADTTRLLSPES